MKSLLFEKLFGELQPRNVYAVYGVPDVGKTVMAMTEVAYQASQGVRTQWIDTEGGINFDDGYGIWNMWKPKLEARFGLKDLNEFVAYKHVDDYEELMEWLAHPVKVDYDENKVKVKFLGKSTGRKLDETIYHDFGRKRDKCMVVLDSMSSPFRLQFGTTLENFSGRSDATAYLIFALNKLIQRVNAPLITNNHASLNPTNQWSMATMRGGATVAYYSKNVAFLDKPKGKTLDTYRKMWGVRSPGAKEWGSQTWLRIDNEQCFVGSSTAEVEAAMAAAKAAKMARREAEDSDE